MNVCPHFYQVYQEISGKAKDAVIALVSLLLELFYLAFHILGVTRTCVFFRLMKKERVHKLTEHC